MKLKHFMQSLLLLLVLLGVWELAATIPNIRFLCASPSLVAVRFFEATLSSELPYHALITGAEAACGFLIGVVAGTLSGFALWYSPRVAALAKPYIFILSIIPPFAFAPLIIIWFGIDFGMKVAVASLATFIVSLGQAYEGCQTIDQKSFELFRIMGASRAQMLWKLVFPSSLTWVFNSLKINVGVALLGAFIGEFISADRGVGYFMIKTGSLYDIAGVCAGAIYLVGLAALLRWVVVALEARKIAVARFFSVSKLN